MSIPDSRRKIREYPDDTPKKPNLNFAVLVVIVWIIMAFYMWFVYPGPGEWQWLSYIPIAVLGITAGVSITGIILSRKTDLLEPTTCHIGNKDYTMCIICPNAEVKANQIYADAFPIVKCKDKKKQVFNPRSVPRWCPHGRR
jgi:hypothetical protein